MEEELEEQIIALLYGESNIGVEVDQKLYPRPGWAVKQIVRSSGLVENVCCHGVGHPHPASVKKFEEAGIMSMGVHGCDFCCCDEETKATIMKKIKEHYDE